MKSKIILLSLTLQFLIISVQAQPGCRTNIFNPFDTFHHSDVDNVIYGSATETERLNDWVQFSSGGIPSRDKLKIQVNEELKGKVNKKNIEVFIGYDCVGQVGGTAIYKLKKAYIGDSPVWVTDQVSYMMNYPKREYSEQGLKDVITKVKSDLKTNNEHNLSGVIVEKFGDEFSFTASDEIQRKLGYHPKNFKPMIGVKVEAKRKTDNKTFRTITDKEGKFTFKNLAYGEYQIYPMLSNFHKIVGFNNYSNDEHSKVSLYVPIRKNWANQRQVFALETFGNLKGKIENIFPEFQRGSFNIWKVVYNDGKIEYREFVRYFLPHSSDGIQSDETSVTFNFLNFPIGEYVLGISGSRTIYFHGKIAKENSKIFEVKAGETTDVTFNIP